MESKDEVVSFQAMYLSNDFKSKNERKGWCSAFTCDTQLYHKVVCLFLGHLTTHWFFGVSIFSDVELPFYKVTKFHSFISIGVI